MARVYNRDVQNQMENVYRLIKSADLCLMSTVSGGQTMIGETLLESAGLGDVFKVRWKDDILDLKCACF